MKLAEALMERKDLVKKINKAKEEITSNLVTKEGFELPLDMDKLFLQYESDQNNLMKLNTQIDKTNVILIDRLNRLRILDSKMAFYRECRKSLLEDSSNRFYNENVKMTRNYDLNKANTRLDKLELLRREVDKEIQKINWATELTE